MNDYPYIHRQLEEAVLAGTARPRAELILGPRQVGKTTMLNHLVEGERVLRLTSEDEQDLSLLADPSSYLKLTGTIAVFECKAGQKVSSVSLKAFLRAYPRIPVTVVSPETIDQLPETTVPLEEAFQG